MSELKTYEIRFHSPADKKRWEEELGFKIPGKTVTLPGEPRGKVIIMGKDGSIKINPVGRT